VLEGEFELVLANAAHIKNVPGRKSDVNDATWIADLLAHGLIRASFVPPGPIQRMTRRHRVKQERNTCDTPTTVNMVWSLAVCGRQGGRKLNGA